MAFAEAPVSNSAGQTRFPTFSRIARSRPSVPSAASPCLVMSASRWHMPPVCSCTAFTFVCAIRNASTSESMSASMTPIFISSRRSSMVFSSVVVFPAPGEDIRFRRNTPFSFSSFLRSSACLSLSAKTLCLISYTFTIVFFLHGIYYLTSGREKPAVLSENPGAGKPPALFAILPCGDTIGSGLPARRAVVPIT